MKFCFLDCVLDKCPVYCCLARTTERIKEKLKFDDELVTETPGQSFVLVSYTRRKPCENSPRLHGEVYGGKQDPQPFPHERLAFTAS